MAGRRLTYLAVLAGSLVFYWFYREWLGGLLAFTVLALPWFSLVLSLPAMVLCRLRLQAPAQVTVGTEARVSWKPHCPLPPPPLMGKLRTQHSFTGEKALLRSGEVLNTAHCGTVTLLPKRIWMCDYLGLWRLPTRKQPKHLVLVRPVPLPPPEIPDISRFLCSAMRPKAGGGYAENHELRLYRPGDPLRQIHWKLTVKTGKLITREPQETVPGSMLLTLELRGSPEELDYKLGRLLWLSRWLAGKQLSHQVCCLTGSGMCHLPVSNETEADAAVNTLLNASPATADMQPVYPQALWRCHIGGNADE